MARSLRLWLVVAALLAGMLVAACGGDDDKKDSEDGERPAATQVVDEQEGDGADEGDEADADEGDQVDAGGDAFDDVPLPAGADEKETITLSGSELPFIVPPGADVDVEALGEVTMIQYEVDGSPDEVLDFYKDRRGDWDEAFAISTDEGGLLVWTSDGGDRVVWIVVSEGSEAGTTELILVEGGLED